MHAATAKVPLRSPRPWRRRVNTGGASEANDDGRRALKAASIAFYIDAFDAYVPVIALAPAYVYFLPDSIPVALRTTLAYIVFFTLSWIGRPLGAVVFGHFGDTIGRRRITLLSIGGFGISTLLMGLLPGYASIGFVGVALFAILRLLGGMCIGGEYTGAAPLALEYASIKQRGLWGSLCNIGYPLALASITGLAFILLDLFPEGGPTAAYSVWGWRIPFYIGALMALVLTYYYYTSIPESEVWAKSTKSKSPLIELSNAVNRRRMAQVFVLMLGAWFTLNTVAGSIGTVLHVILKVNGSIVTLAIFISTLVGAMLFPFMGVLGQKIGRKKAYIGLGIINATITPLLYIWLVADAFNNKALLIILVLLIQIPTLLVWSLVTAYITESFDTRVRSSGYGLGFSLATIPAAFYSVYMLWLSNFMPYKYTQIVFLALGGGLIAVGACMGSDNRMVEFVPDVALSSDASKVR